VFFVRLLNSDTMGVQPRNYAVIFTGYGALVIGICYLVPLLPFCTLQEAMFKNRAIGANYFIEGLNIKVSLWDIEMHPRCNTLMPGVRVLAHKICHGLDPIWGKHRMHAMVQDLCNFQEQLAVLGGGFLGGVGCDRMTIMHIGTLISGAMFGIASLLCFCGAANVYAYQQIDNSPRRKRICFFFFLLAPICAAAAMACVVFTFDIQNLMFPGILVPVSDDPYPLGWGSVWVAMTCFMNLIVVLMLMCFLQNAPVTDDERKRFEDYKALQAESMLSTQSGGAQSGYDQAGYDQSGYDQSGYDQSGYDQSGYDQSGQHYGQQQQGYPQQGQQQAGYY